MFQSENASALVRKMKYNKCTNTTFCIGQLVYIDTADVMQMWQNLKNKSI